MWYVAQQYLTILKLHSKNLKFYQLRISKHVAKSELAYDCRYKIARTIKIRFCYRLTFVQYNSNLQCTCSTKMIKKKTPDKFKRTYVSFLLRVPRCHGNAFLDASDKKNQPLTIIAFL